MKSTLRTKVAAAAMLLVPVGAMLAASPASAQSPWRSRDGTQEYLLPSDPSTPETNVPALSERGLARRTDRVLGRDGDYRDSRDRRGDRADRAAPRIFDVTPDNGERVSERGRTRISARFDDRESGVADVTLRVDGRDVTGRARVDGNDLRYADNLRPGRHVAELLVRDRAGNTARRAWSFEVLDDMPGRGYGYGQDGYRGYDDQPRRW